MEKVNALYDYMEDNNITIAENRNGGLLIIDTINDKGLSHKRYR